MNVSYVKRWMISNSELVVNTFEPVLVRARIKYDRNRARMHSLLVFIWRHRWISTQKFRLILNSQSFLSGYYRYLTLSMKNCWGSWRRKWITTPWARPKDQRKKITFVCKICARVIQHIETRSDKWKHQRNSRHSLPCKRKQLLTAHITVPVSVTSQ